MNKTFDIDCELNYTVHSPTTFVFKIEASEASDQRILSESLSVWPALTVQRHTDRLTGTRTLRLSALPGCLSVRYCATVNVHSRERTTFLQEADVGDIPLDVLPYLHGSRYVESELVFAEAVNWIGAFDRGAARVERICRWVKENVRYEIGTSLPYGTIRDVLANRTGVCRDYAHVAIALCRALNIPARFVVGHVMWDTPPPDFHALFEAWLGGQWVLFDPTLMASTEDVIRIGSGHDAADLPFATFFGSATMTRMSPLVFPTLADARAAA